VIAYIILATIFAYVAFEIYRSGGFLNMQFQRKTREEAPAQFWAWTAVFSSASLMCVILAVRDMLRV